MVVCLPLHARKQSIGAGGISNSTKHIAGELCGAGRWSKHSKEEQKA